jgi:hypothetical protein
LNPSLDRRCRVSNRNAQGPPRQVVAKRRPQGEGADGRRRHPGDVNRAPALPASARAVQCRATPATRRRAAFQVHRAVIRVGNSRGCNGRGCRRPGWCTGWCTEPKASAEARDLFRPIGLSMRRTKEPTSGLEPLTCSLRVRQWTLLEVAQGCKPCINRAASILYVAQRCTVLRSRWCQSGVNIALGARTIETPSGARRDAHNLPIARRDPLPRVQGPPTLASHSGNESVGLLNPLL